MGKSRCWKTLTPTAAAAEAAAAADPDGPSTSGRIQEPHGPQRYLCYFIFRYLDFRIPEVTALASLAGCPPEEMQWEEPHGGNPLSPFWYVTFPSPYVAFTVAKYAVLTRGFFEVWGEGATWEELQASIEAFPEARKAPYYSPDITFKVNIDTWGFKFTAEEQREAIQRLQFLPLQGKVDLKAAQVNFWLVCVDKVGNNGMPELPPRKYFLRQVALGDRRLFTQYALTNRLYLGPTSMDTEMAFLMVNQAHVTRGSLVMDPYVGTGSILLAAAARGAVVLGADIDIRVLKLGKLDKKTGKHHDIYSNFQQYGLPWPAGLLRMDMHTPPLRPGLCEVLDAIVGDPPYGVRAGGRKSVAKDREIRYRETHIPSTDPYPMTECIVDLLDLAGRLLKVGGRLVFFIPAIPDEDSGADLPQHPVLHMVENTEQPLTTRYSRRLITLVKTRTCLQEDQEGFKKAMAGFSMKIDAIAELVYAPPTKDGDSSSAVSQEGLLFRKFRGKMC